MINESVIKKLKADEATKGLIAAAHEVRVQTVDVWLNGGSGNIMLTTVKTMDILKEAYDLTYEQILATENAA